MMHTCALLLLSFLSAVFGAAIEHPEDVNSPKSTDYVFVHGNGQYSRTPSPASPTPILNPQRVLQVTNHNHFGEITPNSALNAYLKIILQHHESDDLNADKILFEDGAFDVREFVSALLEELLNELQKLEEQKLEANESLAQVVEASTIESAEGIFDTALVPEPSSIESGTSHSSQINRQDIVDSANLPQNTASTWPQTSTTSIVVGALAVLAAFAYIRNQN